MISKSFARCKLELVSEVVLLVWLNTDFGKRDVLADHKQGWKWRCKNHIKSPHSVMDHTK